MVLQVERTPTRRRLVVSYVSLTHFDSKKASDSCGTSNRKNNPIVLRADVCVVRLCVTRPLAFAVRLHAIRSIAGQRRGDLDVKRETRTSVPNRSKTVCSQVYCRSLLSDRAAIACRWKTFRFGEGYSIIYATRFSVCSESSETNRPRT